MDLTESPAEQAYRKKLRSWLADNLPQPFEGDKTGKEYLEYLKTWQNTLTRGGWLGVTWPEEYGGQGLGPVEQAIISEEMATHHAPDILGMVGVALIGPTIATVGTEEQKERYLKKILLGEEIWAQGFSEPNAGSDLGALATRAVRDGDDFIVNGQKTWTSYADVSDWLFMLVRTDPEAKKYRGITCLLVDLKSDGVLVRPLRMMSGDTGFSEIFFSDARVPAANVLGEVNGGWNVAMTALMHERANIGGGAHIRLYQFFTEIVELARRRGIAGDPLVRQKLAQVSLDLEVFRMTTARAMSAVGRGQTPGPEGSILKLHWSNCSQRLVQTAFEIAGPFGQLTTGEYEDLPYTYLRARANSIEGGSSEMLKNTIGTRVLGLPKSY